MSASSQETHVSASQDSCATLSPDKSSPTASVSSSSQAREVADVTQDDATMEHDEYFETVLQKCGNRVLLKPLTRRPRLWQHQSHTYPALMVYDGIDDGVRLVATGITWCVEGRQYEVVLVGAIGWRAPKGNTRSHQVCPAGPVYAFVRDVAFKGKAVRFSQLRKAHIHNLFTKGEPAAEVDIAELAKAMKLREDFLAAKERAPALWNNIATFKYLVTSEVKKKPKVTRPKSKAKKKGLDKTASIAIELPRTSSRIKLMEQKQTSRRQQLEAAKAAKIRKQVEAKKARQEAQKKQKELKEKIRGVVRETLDTFKANVNRQLKTVRGTVGKNKKQLEEDFSERLDNLQGEMKERLEKDLGARVAELARKVDSLTSGLDVCNELRVKCAKRTRKMLQTLNGKVKDAQKKLSKQIPKKKSRKTKTSYGRQRPKENVDAPIPAAPAAAPAPAIVSRPATPMVNFSAADRGFAMYTSPPAQPAIPVRGSHTPPVPHFAPNGQQYVSPAFATRNFAR